MALIECNVASTSGFFLGGGVSEGDEDVWLCLAGLLKETQTKKELIEISMRQNVARTTKRFHSMNSTL